MPGAGDDVGAMPGTGDDLCKVVEDTQGGAMPGAGDDVGAMPGGDDVETGPGTGAGRFGEDTLQRLLKLIGDLPDIATRKRQRELELTVRGIIWDELCARWGECDTFSFVRQTGVGPRSKMERWKMMTRNMTEHLARMSGSTAGTSSASAAAGEVGDDAGYDRLLMELSHAGSLGCKLDNASLRMAVQGLHEMKKDARQAETVARIQQVCCTREYCARVHTFRLSLTPTDGISLSSFTLDLPLFLLCTPLVTPSPPLSPSCMCLLITHRVLTKHVYRQSASVLDVQPPQRPFCMPCARRGACMQRGPGMTRLVLARHRADRPLP